MCPPPDQKHILDKAMREASSRLEAMRREQADLLAADKRTWEENPQSHELSGAGLKKLVCERMARDSACISALNQAISTRKTGEGIPPVPYQIRFNKMSFLLAEGEKFLSTDDTDGGKILQMVNGQFPVEYIERHSEGSGLCQGIPVIENTDEGFYWGTYRATVISTLAYEVYFTLKNTTMTGIPSDSPISPMRSSISHVVSFPPDLPLPTECSFSYHDGKVITGLGFPHSGYTYGGSRNQQYLYPTGKSFPPHDCSDWLAKMTGCGIEPFTTKEQWKSYFETQHPLRSVFDPIKLSDVGPGDVVALYRSNQPCSQVRDCSGHAGILCEERDRKLYVINYNRSYEEGPRIDGPHIRVYQTGIPEDERFQTLANTASGYFSRIMFFATKDKPEQAASSGQPAPPACH